MTGYYEMRRPLTRPQNLKLSSIVKFDDSSYSTDPIIGALEAAGSYGDTVLVEGVSTGLLKSVSDSWTECGRFVDICSSLKDLP